jgi:hypothetical protein
VQVGFDASIIKVVGEDELLRRDPGGGA